MSILLFPGAPFQPRARRLLQPQEGLQLPLHLLPRAPGALEAGGNHGVQFPRAQLRPFIQHPRAADDGPDVLRQLRVFLPAVVQPPGNGFDQRRPGLVLRGFAEPLRLPDIGVQGAGRGREAFGVVGQDGLSKLEGENLFFIYAKETGAKVYVYRFPNLVGKWVRPNYNSAVGTFCNNIANDLPITVNDPSVELELLFIDDLIDELYNALEGHPLRCEYPQKGEVIDGTAYDGITPRWCRDGKYCGVSTVYKATLGHIVKLLRMFHDQPQNLIMPSIPPTSFEHKLYSMYLSYLPKDKISFDLKMNCDHRGSFTEILKSFDHGQFSVNISNPGITKGQHWHNSKWELFIVVSGHGLIQERKIGTNEVLEFEVSGDRIQAVHMLPGYTHNIINLSETEKLVTLMWSNEVFDPNHPDTYFEKV